MKVWRLIFNYFLGCFACKFWVMEGCICNFVLIFAIATIETTRCQSLWSVGRKATFAALTQNK